MARVLSVVLSAFLLSLILVFHTEIHPLLHAMALKIGLSLLYLTELALTTAPVDKSLQLCGDVWYLPSMYTCYDTNFLCPVINGTPTLRCGPDCYLTSMYR